MASNSTSTATVSEGGIPTLLLRGEAAQHQADLIHGHEARTQQQQRTTTTRPDGLRSDREYHEAWTGGDPGEFLVSCCPFVKSGGYTCARLVETAAGS